MLLLLHGLIFLVLFEFSIIIWVLNFTDFTSREQSRKREICMFQYNLDALLSPWFVAGSHSPAFEFSQSQNSMFTLFSKKKETDLFSIKGTTARLDEYHGLQKDVKIA